MEDKDLLNALLSTEDRPERDVPMKRFGKDANFRIIAIDGEVIDKMRKQCTYVTGKGANKNETFDDSKFACLIVKEGTLSPNFADKKLLDKYETHDAVDVIKKRLLAGERARLSADILDLSGFTDDTDDGEEVKN